MTARFVTINRGLIMALHPVSLCSVPTDPPAVETHPQPSWLAVGLCLVLSLPLIIFGILAALYMLLVYPHLSSSRFIYIPTLLAGWSVVASSFYSFYSFYRLAGYPCYTSLRTLIHVVALFFLFFLLRFMDFILGIFDGRTTLNLH